MSSGINRVLNDVGKNPEQFTMPDGSRLTLLPYGARVLSLAAAAETSNFFWTNPLLDRTDTARTMFSRSGWHNTGGDRTWIAPELDTFFPTADDNEYLQPRQLDMSDYCVERTRGGIQLSRSMSLHLARADRDVSLRLTKWFGGAPNPLRHERQLATTNDSVAYAGYTQRVTLQFLDDAAESVPPIGIWNLIQLPPGGQMLVPLYSRAIPQRCFGEVPSDSVTIDDHLLRVKIDFPGSHKIALKAVALCGRAGYIYEHDGQFTLVVRNFSVNPSGEYVDVQRHDPDDFGYGFQMCRVDEPEFGNFCELEYHAPALGAFPDPRQSEDISQVWAFRGSKTNIDLIAQNLLGAGL